MNNTELNNQEMQPACEIIRQQGEALLEAMKETDKALAEAKQGTRKLSDFTPPIDITTLRQAIADAKQGASEAINPKFGQREINQIDELIAQFKINAADEETIATLNEAIELIQKEREILRRRGQGLLTQINLLIADAKLILEETSEEFTLEETDTAIKLSKESDDSFISIRIPKKAL